MFEIREEKNRIRSKYKAMRAELDPERKSRLDDEICRRFMTLAAYRYSDTILFFAPTDGEIDVMPIVRAALAAGKRAAFPRCDADTNTMTFHYISSPEQLTPGSYGIREPAADCEVWEPEKVSGSCACIVPALVYDRQGFRLGYGRGYYDRFLLSFPGTKVGLVYRDFIADRVPRGRFDAAVDVIITEKGVISLNA